MASRYLPFTRQCRNTEDISLSSRANARDLAFSATYNERIVAQCLGGEYNAKPQLDGFRGCFGFVFSDFGLFRVSDFEFRASLAAMSLS